MSKKRVFWITLLVVLMQLGLTGIQLFWLKKTYYEKEAYLEEHVKAAFRQVTRRIDPGDPLHSAILALRTTTSESSQEAQEIMSQLKAMLDDELKKQEMNQPYALALYRSATPFFISPGDETPTKETLLVSSESFKNPDYTMSTLCRGCNISVGMDVQTSLPALFLKQLTGLIAIVLFLLLIQTGVFYYIISTIGRYRKLEVMKESFINHMTHELNTPIFSISLAVKHLEKTNIPKNPTEALEYIQIIKEENARLKSNVGRVLDVTKLESGAMHLKRESFRFKTIVDQVIRAVSLKKSGLSASFHTGGIPEDLEIKADKELIRNALFNLLDNACKYAGIPNVNITISIERTDDMTVITVADNGQGIAASEKQAIFQKFYRGTRNIEKTEGAGLGLSYVQLIMTAHGGEVRLISQEEKGSKFQLFLPNKIDTD